MPKDIDIADIKSKNVTNVIALLEIIELASDHPTREASSENLSAAYHLMRELLISHLNDLNEEQEGENDA